MDEFVRMIQMEIGALEQTDYATLKKDDTLMVEHGKFRLEVLPRIKPILQSGTHLKIALNETRIEFLQKQIGTRCYSEANDKLTSSQSRIAKSLKDTLEVTAASEALVDSYLHTIDKYCNNRFGWDEIKGKLEFQHIWELENKSYDNTNNAI